MVNGISPALSGLDPTSWSAAQARRESSVSTDLLAVQASSETTAEIDITTKDGDTVTISLASDIEAGYAYYRRTGTAAGSEMEARALVASVSRELQITVQGSLDQEELADITNLVKQLGQAIRSFVNGDTTASARQALDVKALDSLSGFSLDMEHSDSLTLIRASAATQTEVVGTVTFEGPVAQPTPALPSSDDTVPVSGAGPRGMAWTDPVRSDITGLLDAMRKAVEDSGIDLSRSGRLLVKSLQRLLHDIARQPASRSARPALEELSTRLPGHLSRESD
jgi:hypothetical protein